MGTPLSYQPRPGRSRRSLVLRLAAVLALIAGGIVGIDRLRTAWPDLSLRWTYRQCASHRFPEGQVVFEPVPLDDQRPGVHTFQLTKGHWPHWTPQSFPAVVADARPWAAMRARLGPGYFNPVGSIFVHERRTPSGQACLVIIGLRAQGELLLSPQTLALPTADTPLSHVGGFMDLQIDTDHLDRLRLFAGRPDPADPTRFTIPYTVDGKPGVIEGKVGDDRTVYLTPSTGWIGRGTHADTWIVDDVAERRLVQTEAARRIAGARGMGNCDSVRNGLAFTPDGQTLIVGHEKGLNFIDLASGRQRAQLLTTDDSLECLAVSSDGRLAAATGWGHLFVRDITQPTDARLIPGAGQVDDLRFSADGRRLLSVHRDHDCVRAWDVASGRQVWEVAQHQSHPNSLVLAPDGKTALVAGTGYVLEIDLAGSKLVRTLHVYDTPLDVSPDGKHVLTDGGPGVSVVEARTRKPALRRYNPDRGTGSAFPGTATGRFSPAGTAIAVMVPHAEPPPAGGVGLFGASSRPVDERPPGSDICLWDFPAGRTQWLLQPPERDAAQAMAFSPDGQTLATVNDKGDVLLWKLDADLAPGK